MFDLEDAKRVPIRDILASLGYRTENANNFYYSPFAHNERTPSFHVSPQRNIWYDFSTAQGGTNIDLVMKLRRVSFKEAVSYILGIDCRISIQPQNSYNDRAREQTPAIEILSIFNGLYSYPLKNYVKERGVSVKIAEKYCKEIKYRNKGKEYYALGFPNDSGGYSLRSGGARSFKASTRQGVTSITRDGDFSTVKTCDSVLVFEGFFDFLSYLQLNNINKPNQDVVILNSTSNLSKSLEYLKEHKVINCYLDNDKGGEAAFVKIKNECKDCEVINNSHKYANEKDVNEHLTKKHQLSKNIKL